MDTPFLRIEDSGEVIPLRGEVTTVGRGRGADIRLDDPSVSPLHAELVRRGPYVYVDGLGLSRNGTRVNGRPVTRRVLSEGDVLSFGAARCRIGGIEQEDITAEADLRRPAPPELTRRELDVLASLCRPALSDEAFAIPVTAHQIAADLVVTEAAVKQHLLRLYQKFRVPAGPNRRTRLANEVVALGLVNPAPANPTGARPAPANPTGANPAPANPTGAKPAPANPMGARPAPANPTGANPAPVADTGETSGVAVPGKPGRRGRDQAV